MEYFTQGSRREQVHLKIDATASEEVTRIWPTEENQSSAPEGKSTAAVVWHDATSAWDNKRGRGRISTVRLLHH
jgi:hypothetical protein